MNTRKRVVTQVRDEAADVRFVHFHQRLRTPHLSRRSCQPTASRPRQRSFLVLRPATCFA